MHGRGEHQENQWWGRARFESGPGEPPFPPGPRGPRRRRWIPDDEIVERMGGHPGRGFGRPRAARGDVRNGILALLDEAPMHGYQIMQELNARSDGAWNPSPGSVYPTLQSLEDEGLVKAEERDGRRVFQLTDDGRAHVAERRAAIGEPWKEVAGDADRRFFELRDLAGQVAAAVRQVARAGNAAQVEQTKKLLTDTRRNLYRLLAEDDGGTGGG